MTPDDVEPVPDTPEATAADLAVPEPDVPAGPACRVCNTLYEPGQDWCLSCGTALAAPRRLPPLRSLGAATAATLVLLGGAAVASVAAIDHHKPGRATVVATIATAAPLPSGASGATGAVVDPLVTTPPAAAAPLTPVTQAPIPAPVTPAKTGTTGATGTTGTTGSSGGTKKDPTRVSISAGSGAPYDPLGRLLQTGDPQRAIDGDAGTSWFITTPADGDMNVGYLIDLGEAKTLKRLEVITKTPGMTLRILGATTVDPPPSLDDTGWTEIAQEPDAGIDDNGKPRASSLPVKVPLQTRGKKFRLVAITIETPPLSGATARFTELRLFG